MYSRVITAFEICVANEVSGGVLTSGGLGCLRQMGGQGINIVGTRSLTNIATFGSTFKDFEYYFCVARTMK